MATIPAPPPTTARVSPRLVALAVAACGVAALSQVMPDTAAGVTDYVEYAAAARLLRDGGNPYDGSLLLPLQKGVGWPFEKADMMWNPPWVFPLVLPNAWLGWGEGLTLWVAVQLAAVLAAAHLAWRMADGPRHQWWVPIAIVLLFAPAFYLFRLGQISGFLLLGLVGFAAALKAGRPALAGLAAALVAVKPHLFLPFAVLLACDALVSKATRRAVIVGAAVLAVCAAFPLLWNADVWSQYVAAVNAPSGEFHWAPSAWKPPILSQRLAELVGGGLAVQFAPSVLATLVLVAYWWTKRRTWDWSKELPLVVVLSMLTTGYGAWGFDVVVMLYPVVQAAAWVANRDNPRLTLWAAAAYLAYNAAVFPAILGGLWWVPLVAAGYFAVGYAVKPPSVRTGLATPSPG